MRRSGRRNSQVGRDASSIPALIALATGHTERMHKMDLCVIGTGYVGLVVGVCMADLGFRVACTDNDTAKIDRLRNGDIPLYEPGLLPILSRNVREGRLTFTTDTAASIASADVTYIAVGTPGLENGHADLSGVFAVASLIGRHMTRPMVAVIKSTVPVGTADRVREAIGEHAKHEYDVVSNPEFLKEGAAIEDFSRPDRIVIGCRTQRARDVMQHLYAGLLRTGRPIFFMDNRSAEMTKYASNALLATKISFMNELSRLCERTGADIEMVRRGAGGDTRIGTRFLFAGAGYGGSCFPKDVRALARTAADHGHQARILEAVETVNQAQKQRLFEKLSLHFDNHLTGRSIALWGLSFKPETDDMREAPSLVLMQALWQAGARVRAHDPKAMPEARHLCGERDDLELFDDPYDALEGADALVLITEWKAFWSPDFDRIRTALAQPVIFDGRNIYDPAQMHALGFTHYAIGRGNG